MKENKISKEELDLEEVNTEEIVAKGRGKIKINDEYVTASEIKEKDNFYMDAAGYKYKKDEKESLFINYVEEDKTKTLCIVDFREGDYGLWIEEDAPYYLEEGKIIEQGLINQGTKGEVLSLEENQFLEEEERIKDNFLWIYPQEVISFPEEKEKSENEAESKDVDANNVNQGSKRTDESSSKQASRGIDKSSSKQKSDSSGSSGGGQLYVCSGAELECSFGDAASDLKVLASHNSKVCGNLVANIMDYQGMKNILPFGKCHTTNNPNVAAATSANNGNLTPQPCIPNIPAPWTKPKSDVKVGEHPALLANSKLTCAYSGKIIIVDPGQSILKE